MDLFSPNLLFHLQQVIQWSCAFLILFLVFNQGTHVQGKPRRRRDTCSSCCMGEWNACMTQCSGVNECYSCSLEYTKCTNNCPGSCPGVSNAAGFAFPSAQNSQAHGGRQHKSSRHNSHKHLKRQRGWKAFLKLERELMYSGL